MEIINKLETAMGETVRLLSSFTEKQLNTVPYKGSWTAAQVGRHLQKAGTGLDVLFNAPSGPVDRDAGKNIAELEQIFLDFSKKYQAPDFIIPEDKIYNREQLIQALQEIKDKTTEAAQKANLMQLAPLPGGHPFEGYTKLEMVYFVTYHTQRHNHQLEKIREAMV